jgi:kumamolisin
VEFDEYDPTMVNDYLSFFGLPKKYQPKYVDTSSYAPGLDEIEADMDMEVVSAIAPQANQLVYIGPPASSVTEAQLEDVYNGFAPGNTDIIGYQPEGS